ncbi:MAG: SPOR domain-containing protein [Myxococcota bacterium]
MAEVAQMHGQRQIRITRSHLAALSLSTLLIAALAFFVGLRVGQGQASPPPLATTPALLPDPEKADALEALLRQAEAVQAEAGGAELSFPDALASGNAPQTPTQRLPRVALPVAVSAEPQMQPPTPASLPPLPVKEGWVVQVGSYEAAADADAQVAVLNESGWPAYRVTALVKGSNWHRVRVGGYPDREAASAASAELAANLGAGELMIARAP